MLGIRLVFVFGGAALGAFYPFLAVILQDRGFEPFAIGLVTGAAALAYAVAVPAWGHLADVTLGRTGALRLAALGGGLALATFALPWPAIVLAVLVVTYSIFQSPIAPLSDALAVNALRDPEREYARIRLLTSLGFALVAVGCGFVYDAVGYGPAGLLYAASNVGLAASLRAVPDVPRANLGEYRAAARPGRSRGGSFRVALAIQPRLRGVLLGIGLIHVGILAGFTYLPLRLVELGGGPGAVAASAAVSAFAEVPAMLLAGRIATRFGLRSMFVASVLVYVVCFASWIVLDDALTIVLTRIATGVSFAGLWVAAVLTVGVLLPPRLQGTGQGLYQTVGFGVAAIVGNVGGGFVYGTVGSGWLFALTALLGLLAAAVGWRSFPVRGERIAADPARVGRVAGSQA